MCLLNFFDILTGKQVNKTNCKHIKSCSIVTALQKEDIQCSVGIPEAQLNNNLNQYVNYFESVHKWTF